MKTQLAIVSLLTGASQIAAFFKLWFTAHVFGVGSALDGYNLALVLPTLISGVMAGVLQTGLFPVRARIYAQYGEEVVAMFERFVLLSVVLMGVLMATIVMSSSPFLVPMLAGSAQPSVQAAFGFALPLAAWLIALNFLGDCTGFLLAIRKRFAYAAGAPVVNGVIGGVLLAAWPEGGLLNLVLGTLFGLVAQVGICLFGLKTTGFRFVGALPVVGQMRARAREMFALGGWILPGVMLSNLVVSLPPIWVASFGEGAVSAFGYAYRLHSSALQLIVMASSTVILARFAELVAGNEPAAIRSILRKALVVSAVLGSVGLVLVDSLGESLLDWLFRGRFDASAASRVAEHWWWLTAGLGFSILGNVFAKLWQAQGRPGLISLMAGGSLFALVSTYLMMQRYLEEYSPAAALSMSACAVVVLGFRFVYGLPRRIDLWKKR